MKKIFSSLAALLLIVVLSLPHQVNAQAQQTMTYQSILRDSNYSSLTNLQVGVKIVILQSSDNGKKCYVET